MQMDDQKLIKSTHNLTKEDMNLLREKFISEYARKKGWNKEKLSPDQMLEIVEQNGYKNPGLVLS